jgi:hypothetical protein
LPLGTGRAGHVAGWIGVGGVGLGPNGTTEWLQVGYAAFDTGETQIYDEVTLPNKAPAYHTVVAKLSPSAKNEVTVFESATTQGSWQVLLDGRPVSSLISLPASHGTFSPQALGETWNWERTSATSGGTTSATFRSSRSRADRGRAARRGTSGGTRSNRA